jgi:transcriptional regulator with XRE-family HTH domain
MARKTFSSLLDRAKQSDAYWSAKAVHEFTEDLVRLMEQRGLTKSELAAKLGCSPAYVTKILRGNANFTVDSMVRLARAVDGCLTLHVGRSEDQTRWFDVVGRGTPGNAVASGRSFRPVPDDGQDCDCLRNHVQPEGSGDASYTAAA